MGFQHEDQWGIKTRLQREVPGVRRWALPATGFSPCRPGGSVYLMANRCRVPRMKIMPSASAGDA